MKYLVTIYYLSVVYSTKQHKSVRRWRKFTSEKVETKKLALVWIRSFSRVKNRKVSIQKL